MSIKSPQLSDQQKAPRQGNESPARILVLVTLAMISSYISGTLKKAVEMTDVMDQRDEAIYENKRIVNHATSAIVELTGEIIERGKMLNSMLASIQTESELFETAMARLGEASLERNALIRLIEANKDVREALESLGTLESERLSADELNTFLFLDYELNKLLIEMDENFDGDIDTKAINSIVNHASDLYQLVYNFIYHRPSDYPGPDDKAAANE